MDEVALRAQEAELNRAYTGSTMWKEDADRASAHYKVVYKDADTEWSSYVEAQAGTGSRYAVFCHRISSRVEPLHEAEFLFSIVHPWNRTIMLHVSSGGPLYLTYLLEKLKIDGVVHGGDLMATALTMLEALKTIAGLKGAARDASAVVG